MTGRALPRTRLRNLVPSLVEAQALVALVPATGDLRWAAAAAWDVARAAAQHGRRVALVDLWLEEPRLHEAVGLALSEGIVDAFEYGVSLTKAAHEVDGVFFIAAGAYTAHPGDLFGHERWRKLHGGFRVEGALLLLYLSAGALARLSAVPDGLIVLSPEGFEPESSIGQGIAAALERGIPLLGVVRERWTPAATPAPAGMPPARPPSGTRPAQRPAVRRTRPIIVAAALAAGAAGSWGLLTRGAEQRATAFAGARDTAHTPGPVTPTAPDTAAPRPHMTVVDSASPPATAVTPAAPTADSLPWTVQLAAYGTLDRALALADRLAASDMPAFVTPVALEGDQGAAIWYRVVAGAFGTRDSATAARAALWAQGIAVRGHGDVLHAPYSLSLGGPGRPDSLRARGIPAVRWGPAGILVVGAFETPEQAGLAAAQLKRAGVRATLITRIGNAP